MQKGTVVELKASLAIAASRLSLEHNLPMVDSIILATAQEFNVIIWTQDEIGSEKGSRQNCRQEYGAGKRQKSRAKSAVFHKVLL